MFLYTNDLETADNLEKIGLKKLKKDGKMFVYAIDKDMDISEVIAQGKIDKSKTMITNYLTF